MLYQHIPDKYCLASELKEYNFKGLKGLFLFSQTLLADLRVLMLMTGIYSLTCREPGTSLTENRRATSQIRLS